MTADPRIGQIRAVLDAYYDAGTDTREVDVVARVTRICDSSYTEQLGEPEFFADVSTSLPGRLVRAANTALGNDTRNILDCSTAQVVATVLRELAAAEKTFGVGTLQDLATETEAQP